MKYFKGGASEILQNVQVEVENRVACNQSYATLGRIYEMHYPQGLTESLLCAGAVQGENDVCRVSYIE